MVLEDEEKWAEKLRQDEELTKLDGKRRTKRGVREGRWVSGWNRQRAAG